MRDAGFDADMANYANQQDLDNEIELRWRFLLLG
jgi:hypothetical protein